MRATAVDRDLRSYFDAGTTAPFASPRFPADFANPALANDVDEVFWDGMETCGDGSIDAAGEQCDRNDFGGATCLSYGFTAGSLSCDRTCHVDSSQCTGACPVLCTLDSDCGACGPCFEGICTY